ncbi:unnamed protein product [Rhizophagus irregularis]|nr:unnamed protein product [Rhizophagus irregularis]
MIPLENWIPDELHIMLRIWDHLWSLLLAELKECDQFDDVCRNEIMQEMSRIGVHFQFWKETGSNAYNHTSLMGDDKLNDYNAQQFKFESEDWLELFLTSDRAIPNSTRIEKGLYKPSAITPYIHVLVYHMAEFMEKHSRWSNRCIIERNYHGSYWHILIVIKVIDEFNILWKLLLVARIFLIPIKQLIN